MFYRCYTFSSEHLNFSTIDINLNINTTVINPMAESVTYTSVISKININSLGPKSYYMGQGACQLSLHVANSY